jgi:hypothetical protein
VSRGFPDAALAGTGDDWGMDNTVSTPSFSPGWIIASYIAPATLAASGLMIADVFYGNGNFFVAVLAMALATVGLPALAVSLPIAAFVAAAPHPVGWRPAIWGAVAANAASLLLVALLLAHRG